MAQEATAPTPAPADQESQRAQGQEPTTRDASRPEAEAPTPSDLEEALKKVRREAAEHRTERKKLAEANAEMATELERFREAGKTEEQRREEHDAQRVERETALTRRAEGAELALLRYEVAAERGVPPELFKFVTGDNREAIEAAADEVKALFDARESAKVPSFDGGARATPERTGTPDEEHNRFLLGVLQQGPRAS